LCCTSTTWLLSPTTWPTVICSCTWPAQGEHRFQVWTVQEAFFVRVAPSQTCMNAIICLSPECSMHAQCGTASSETMAAGHGKKSAREREREQKQVEPMKHLLLATSWHCHWLNDPAALFRQSFFCGRQCSQATMDFDILAQQQPCTRCHGGCLFGTSRILFGGTHSRHKCACQHRPMTQEEVAAATGTPSILGSLSQ